MMNGKWVVLLAVVLVAGCMTAAAPAASPESDAAAKRFEPAQGKANLYVARSPGSAGGSTEFKLTVDGKELGSITPGTYYLVVLDPGRHSIAAASMFNSVKTELTTEPAKNYFYEVTARNGAPSLGLVFIEEMGKMMVQQGRLARGEGE
jgi:hypothetical protein